MITKLYVLSRKTTFFKFNILSINSCLFIWFSNFIRIFPVLVNIAKILIVPTLGMLLFFFFFFNKSLLDFWI